MAAHEDIEGEGQAVCVVAIGTIIDKADGDYMVATVKVEVVEAVTY